MLVSEFIASAEKTLSHFRMELQNMNVGRASAGMVDEVSVESYGSHMPLKSVANISCPDSHTIRIEPWDKNLVGVVEKALIVANLGMMPQNMGVYLFVPVPPMTEERRKAVVKKVYVLEEDSKIVLRNLRQDVLKKIKTQKDNKEISEDEQKRLEKKIQEEMDRLNKGLEEASKKKEKDLLAIL